MKTVFFLMMTFFSLNTFSQTKPNPSGKINKNKIYRSKINVNNTLPSNSVGNVNGIQSAEPRETATERYLKGPQRKGSGNNSSSEGSTDKLSPFVGGIHAADNAAKPFDSLGQKTAVNNGNQGNASGNTIPGGNDTTFNANSISSSGNTTNSGAVDRSGQSQFGQTNWGSSRGTIGESQWTIPPPITASFNKDFPAANNATWTRNSTDTSLFSARYNNGTSWITSNYNARGERMDTRTEFPLLQAPRPVSAFLAKQPADFQVATIYRLQVMGKPEVFEVKTSSGKTIYINNDGMEVNY